MTTDGRGRAGIADAARRVALSGIAAGIVIGLAACGSTVAGAGTPAKHDNVDFATPKPAATGINPGGPMQPQAASTHVLLCTEIPKLTRMVFTRTPWPPGRHVREALPSGATIRNVAVVRRIATVLCGLPTVPIGMMTCPNMAGSSYRLYFVAPGRAIPVVEIESSGCRVVTGLGRPRTWVTSKALQQALSLGLGARFWPPSPLP
jgi:hypothetical protein